ncbi:MULTISPECIES: Gfo/Idh/MocA family protein [Marinovum]|jgi:predicted dehydrogenase|uniref:Predicted dehydrogenase n=1 Tax=Marinovum algicola TaxID=42444 RepID=A0A975WCE1_9RHOB|nr:MULTISPECIES: Gfo/Idh/MocA family oxidoreductase [Marinovum]AKO99192.1 putative dehydrogenase [Marinovum algicola DG 898]MDD9739379.1 Gfo/Idh/MocA family oxidoreductase [Marinovum sp. SP66]MDD9746287.1 Gfo/Idh/MocA family oxidoreductase [Marinovum sp. PR37]SEJ90359.1 Predicted dehydrogenase [Marinovum algicola]SLN43313.1 putative oxidoreductase YvaA [Marinovum algicola]
MDRIRLGMVGGGTDAFIGAVHRIASRIDDRFELVAGALSSTPEKARTSGAALGLAEDRSYGTFEEMAEREAGRDDGIEAVSIVTPNHVHAAAARAFLERGIHVICDKPLTATQEDAEALRHAVADSKAVFVLTHNYTGYPLVRQAREMVAQGDLGEIRVVQAEYPQDWMTDAVEAAGVKQAEWRTDPARSGAGGSIGDIGTHAYNLACFVTGLKGAELAADLHSFGTGRKLDDNAHVMLRFDGGARGMLWCSQVAPGCENALRLRVFGTKGGLEWAQENPNELWFTPHGEATRRITRMGAGASDAANAVSRVPPGHPEGYLEGFANIYGGAADAIRAVQSGADRDAALGLLPGIGAGLDGMAFIGACVRSSQDNTAWVTL